MVKSVNSDGFLFQLADIVVDFRAVSIVGGQR